MASTRTFRALNKGKPLRRKSHEKVVHQSKIVASERTAHESKEARAAKETNDKNTTINATKDSKHISASFSKKDLWRILLSFGKSKSSAEKKSSHGEDIIDQRGPPSVIHLKKDNWSDDEEFESLLASDPDLATRMLID